MVIERVIYCALSGVAMLGALPHETLLQREDGVVIAVQDAELITLLSHSAPLSLLYFSKNAYQEAIRGLNEQEVKEVIDLRLIKWAPQALDQAVNWLFLAQRQCFAWTALIRSRTSGTNAEALRIHGTRAIDFLARLANERRYDDLGLTEILVVALEKEAELVAELDDAISHEGGLGERNALEGEVLMRKAFSKALVAALTRHGRHEFGDALPYVDLVRVAWIRPRDAELTRALQVEFEPYVEYEDGLVCRRAQRRLIDLERAGKKVAILYIDAGKFLERLAESTPTQLRNELNGRASAPPNVKARMRLEFLCSLRLEQILLKKALRRRAASEDSTLAADLDRQIEQETALLSAEVVRCGVWLSSFVNTVEPGRAALLRCEEVLLKDINFFAALARHQSQDQLEYWLQGLAQAKTADIAVIKSLPEDLR
jgi:hypothetical protein